MNIRTIRQVTFSLLISIVSYGFIYTQPVIDFETGIVSTGYNDVRIPGDQGTLFSLKDDFRADPKIFYRLRLDYTFSERHTLSLLYAPLQIRSDGRSTADINFEGVVFPANSDLSSIYKFNSYRLTYRYKLVQKPKLDLGLGFTAKIRDAKIAISSDGAESEKINVGFVPIINFRLQYHPGDKFSFLIDGDALAAKQGRAEDVFFGATYRLSDLFGLKAGYRILEGGADNDEVYSFALFHYASLGLLLYL